MKYILWFRWIFTLYSLHVHTGMGCCFSICRLCKSVLIDSFQELSVHSCLHYTSHICIYFHLGGSSGSDRDDGMGMY